MKLAKNPLIGERSGKKIGTTLNTVVKDAEEISMKKKHLINEKKSSIRKLFNSSMISLCCN